MYLGRKNYTHCIKQSSEDLHNIFQSIHTDYTDHAMANDLNVLQIQKIKPKGGSTYQKLPNYTCQNEEEKSGYW